MSTEVHDHSLEKMAPLLLLIFLISEIPLVAGIYYLFQL